MLTIEQLKAVCVHAPLARLEPFVEPLNKAMEDFEINTPARQAAFLAQLAHESAEFRYMREQASGAAYEGPSRLATKLGNTEPGDGAKYKGHGPMQITGRKNHRLCGEALGLPLIEEPELLEQPEHGCRAAGWFWTVGAGLNLSNRAKDHGVPENVNLNHLADTGDFEGITLAINGGLNGIDDRLAHFGRAQDAFA